jgi:UDP-N-acetylmuramate: L-alanyl-gamma-D-glutamyl-meso-diaminopimelate ligase
VRSGNNAFPLQIFGKHNLLNLNGARLVCNQLGISDLAFFHAIQSFQGASKRLELIAQTGNRRVYKDFAHAPSKVKATLQAVKEQFPGRKVIACLELHTYSSLNKDFLGHYEGSLEPADFAIVYFNPHALQIKRLPAITPEQVREGFRKEGLEVFTESRKMVDRLNEETDPDEVLLLMSSGNYDGVDLKEAAVCWADL